MKCPICDSKKAKRQCLLVGSICSSCCGIERQKDLCSGCVYYRDPVHNYSDVPSYTTAEMEDNLDLQIIANAIESAIVAFDIEVQCMLQDSAYIRILERLLDVYHFQEQHIKSEDAFFESGFEYIAAVIKNDLPDTDHKTITKILSVLRFVARRRTEGYREHITFLHEFVGARIGKGMRIMSMRDGDQ